MKKIFSLFENREGSQNPSKFEIKIGVPTANDCKVTLCPDGCIVFFIGKIVKKDSL